MGAPRRIVVALTGASGAPYFLRMLDRLRGFEDIELHLIASEGGKRVLQEESNIRWQDLNLSGFTVHPNKNIGASIASGSFRCHGMVVLPCSMNTLACIASGVTVNLIHRCAAVQLKEDRKLILAIRETPLSLINLRAMTSLREAGAVIMPASPGFYHNPQTIQDLCDTVVDRIFDHLGLDDTSIKRWNP
ncbi:MAG: UbiX family flavin prenyltransferase [Acidobacteriota bacterium]|nr:UbiX family flavin prenyltransferase [Acidobacteriota bacterium]